MMSKDAEVVLIVDDTPQNIDVLSGVLRAKYNLKAALDGPKALAIARRDPKPDIILLDIMMPEMDGFEVCKRLKEDPETWSIPVVFITAMTDAEDEALGLDLGVVDYISKPINPGIVMARVRTHLHVAAQQREIAEKEAMLRMALENMPGGMFVVDDKLEVKLLNETYRNIYGDPDNVAHVGGSMRDILTSEVQRGILVGQGSQGQIWEERMGSFHSRKTVTFEDKTNDGRFIQLSRRPAPDGHTVSVAVDITERKMVENQLARSVRLINESIHYASHIQRSVLPTPEEMQNAFSDYCTVWEPKDVVGGDIYLVRQLGRKSILFVADCTGHGVPGAFMTMIATGALDQALLEHPDGDPALVLRRTNQLVKSTLGQHENTKGASDDGFECGLSRIDHETGEMTFAGSRFELWAAVGGEILVTKGDRHGIGYRSTPHDKTFTSTSIAYDPDAVYFLFTDGITDQVGGEKKRGFGKRRFKEFLLEAAETDLTAQVTALMKRFRDYQGDENRRDDVTLVGFSPKV